MTAALPVNSPGAILDRHGRPIASAELSPQFEAASVAARIGTWGLSGAGPNAGSSSIASVRARSRQLERNNPTAKGGIDSFVSNLVGTDISPSWNLPDKSQKDELEELWQDSQLESDFYGNTDFYGQQELVARSVIRDGEILGRFHDLPPDADIVVPLQMQLLEADHLDIGYNDISPSGNEIRFGIEKKNGRRVNYWLYNDHPGESFLTGDNVTRVPVPATDMVHVFRPLRAGQDRGYGWLAPIIVALHDIDVTEDAERIRKKAAALWGGFIYSDGPMTNTRVGTPGKQSATVPSSITLEPGTFPVLPNGYKIDFSHTADVGNNHYDWMKTEFRLVARGLGITYEQLTGDLEGVNYTSLRAGLIEFRRLCETIVARTLVFQFCRPYVNRWTRTAILNGRTRTISVRQYLQNRRLYERVTWNPDGFDFTDPVKDRVGRLMDQRSGWVTRGDNIGKMGGNINRVDRINKQELDQADSLGLKYDSYPNHTTGNGQLQAIIDKTVVDGAVAV